MDTFPHAHHEVHWFSMRWSAICKQTYDCQVLCKNDVFLLNSKHFLHKSELFRHHFETVSDGILNTCKTTYSTWITPVRLQEASWTFTVRTESINLEINYESCVNSGRFYSRLKGKRIPFFVIFGCQRSDIYTSIRRTGIPEMITP